MSEAYVMSGLPRLTPDSSRLTWSASSCSLFRSGGGAGEFQAGGNFSVHRHFTREEKRIRQTFGDLHLNVDCVAGVHHFTK